MLSFLNFSRPQSLALLYLHLKKSFSLQSLLSLEEKYLLSALLRILNLSHIFSMDMHTLYLLFSCRQYFIRFCVKPSQRLVAALWLSLEWCADCSVCVLSGSWVGFLYMLVSYLQRPALAILRDMHREQP